jgi:hypothetical protein
MGVVEEKIRLKIVDAAKKLARDGAHYLWGAEGQKPHLATKHLKLNDPEHVVFCAGVLNGCICVGRFSSIGMRSGIRHPQKVWNPATDGGVRRYSTIKCIRLKNSTLHGLPPEFNDRYDQEDQNDFEF